MPELPQIGARAPDFTLPSTEGTPYNLYSNLGEFTTIITFIRGEW